MKKTGFFNALGTLVYIVIVGTMMRNGDLLFGKTDTFMTPIIVLLLFTLSALVVGGLILGKPIMLYLDDKKKEAVSLFLSTGAWLAIFTVVTIIVAALIR